MAVVWGYSDEMAVVGVIFMIKLSLYRVCCALGAGLLITPRKGSSVFFNLMLLEDILVKKVDS